MADLFTKDLRWWKEVDEPHRIVFDAVRRIRERSSMRQQMDLYHACLYDDSELTGLGPTSYDAVDFEPSRLAFNVVRQSVDTLAAKIAKNEPLPMPITTGGTHRQRRRAEAFGRVIQGQFDASGVWRLSPTIARDCALFGTGISFNYRVGKTIYHERVFPWEVLIDPRDGMYGRPRSLYLKRWVDRFVLAERFPDFEPEIMQCESDTADKYDLGYDQSSDLVLVVMSWHLPSGEPEEEVAPVATSEDDSEEDVATPAPAKPKRGRPAKPKTDGRYVMSISNATLVSKEYKKPYFPLSVIRMSDPIVGWFGTGLAKQLTGLQYTINDTAETLQVAHALSGGYILIEAGSNVNPDKLTNDRGNILTYNGAKPDWINPEPAHPATFDWLMGLLPKAFEMTGVSQLSAQSQKPAGIESAVALNTFNDIETERFSLFAKQYEEYHIDIAWQFFDLLEEIYEEYGNTSIRAVSRERGHRVIDDLDYAKVRLDRSDFALSVFPTSLLSKKPAARLEEIQQLINAGWIDAADGKDLIDFPDLKRYTNLQQGGKRLIESICERIIDAEDPYEDGVYTYPEAEFNLKLCISLGLQIYIDAKYDQVPQDNLDVLLQFIADARTELQKSSSMQGAIDPGIPTPPPADPNALPPGMPPGAPVDPSMMPPPGAPPPMPPGPPGMPPEMPPGPPPAV